MPKNPIIVPGENGPSNDSELKNNGLSKELVQAFSNKVNGNKDYFSNTEKDQMISDFRDFVKKEYGGDMLQKLIKEGKISDELNAYANKGFTLKDFTTSGEKRKTIDTYTRSQTNELSYLQQTSHDMVSKRNKLSDEDKKQCPFDEFCDINGLRTKKDDSGTMVDITYHDGSKVQSVVGLQEAWNDFVKDKTHGGDNDKKERYQSLLDTSDYDPTEKIVCISMARGLYDQIDKLNLSSTQSDQLKAIWEDIFGRDILSDKPISALQSEFTLAGLDRSISNFFALATQNGFTKEQCESLKKVSITTKSCLFYGQKSNELPIGTYEAGQQNSKFSQSTQQVQKLVNAITLTDATNRISNLVEEVDTKIDYFVKIFEMPGNMKGFFSHFENVAKVPARQQQHYYDLQRKDKELRQRLDAMESGDEKNALQKELRENRIALQKLVTSEMNPTWEQLFATIVTATTENMNIIGRSVDPLFTQSLASTLQILKNNHRNASSLTKEQQNILMKSSVYAQLAEVKNKAPLDDLGYNFDQYAQFVSELFDLENKKSYISTKDGGTIELNFTDKKIIGAPYDRQTVTIDDMKSLENLRIEFELDLNNNPDAEMFIKSMTGGNKSRVIHNFFPETGLETMTDSTRVTMIGPDGHPYTGYLSPSYLHTEEDSEEDYSSDAKTAANAFVLYSYPADKYTSGTGQKRVAQCLQGSNKEPVVITSANAKEWKIKIEDKKVTLSDKTINALSRGRELAKEGTINQLYDTAFHEREDRKKSELDEKIQGLQSLDLIDHGDTDEDIQTGTDTIDTLHTQDDLMKNWNNIMFANTSIQPLGEGQRFAFNLQNENEEGEPLFPSWKQGVTNTLFASIKPGSIVRDADGNTISFALAFDAGNTIIQKLKDITITKDNVGRLKDAGIFSSMGYLGEVGFGQDYEKTKSYFKDNILFKGLHWGVLDNLTMKDGKFLKGKDEVTKFVAHDATTDPKTKNKHNVEYTIKPSGKKYEITSTGYFVDDSKNKDGKKKVQTFFSTTTDLAGLLLIISGKKLLPYTDKESAAIDNESSVIPSMETKYYGLRSLRKNIIAGGGKKIWEGFKKKRDDEKDEELQYRIFNERGLYRRLDKKFGGLLEKFDLNVFDDLADETEAASLDYGWKKISAQYEHLKKFHHAHNVGQRAGMEGEENYKTAGASRIAHQFFESAWDDYHNNNGKVDYKKRWKVAASLLYMTEKFKDGYAKEFKQYPRGSYVKIMFGGPAHTVFLKKYAEKEAEFKEDGKAGNKIQSELALFEYNFICDNIGGGPSQTGDVRDLGGKNALGDNDNAWYYQNLYSREYAKALREKVSSAKQSTDPSTDDIKNMIENSNFDHVKTDFYGHLGAFRMKEAVNEFVALNGLAKIEKEANEPFIAFMTGILNGSFIHHLNGDTRGEIKVAARRASIPFTKFVEDKDAQSKIMSLLDLATANMGDKKFSTYCSYDPQDYGALSDNTPDKDGVSPSQKIVKKFTEWMKEADVNKRVVEFLHMDDMSDDNNLMNIWKNDDPIIFGHKVSETPGASNAVSELMNEHYFNPDRGATMDQYNYAGGFKHPRMMIPTVYNTFNKAQDGFKLTDHGQVLRGSLGEQADKDLSKKLHPGQGYKMAYFVDEFFRMFQGVGGINYEESAIRKFYTDIRTVQKMSESKNPVYSPQDLTRVLWFDIIRKAYTPKEPDALILKVLKKYLNFFEKNLDGFNKDMVSKHFVPNDPSQKTFAYIYEPGFKVDQKYNPQKEWRKMKDNDQMKLKRETDHDEQTLLNATMQEANRNMKGTGRGYQSQSGVGQSVDSLIKSLRSENSGERDLESKVIVGGPKIENRKDLVIPSTTKESIYAALNQDNNKPETEDEKTRRIVREEQERGGY